MRTTPVVSLFVPAMPMPFIFRYSVVQRARFTGRAPCDAHTRICATPVKVGVIVLPLQFTRNSATLNQGGGVCVIPPDNRATVQPLPGHGGRGAVIPSRTRARVHYSAGAQHRGDAFPATPIVRHARPHGEKRAVAGGLPWHASPLLAGCRHRRAARTRIVGCGGKNTPFPSGIGRNSASDFV
jgi:hypothetical protein